MSPSHPHIPHPHTRPHTNIFTYTPYHITLIFTPTLTSLHSSHSSHPHYPCTLTYHTLTTLTHTHLTPSQFEMHVKHSSLRPDMKSDNTITLPTTHTLTLAHTLPPSGDTMPLSLQQVTLVPPPLPLHLPNVVLLFSHLDKICGELFTYFFPPLYLPFSLCTFLSLLLLLSSSLLSPLKAVQ